MSVLFAASISVYSAGALLWSWGLQYRKQNGYSVLSCVQSRNEGHYVDMAIKERSVDGALQDARPE